MMRNLIKFLLCVCIGFLIFVPFPLLGGGYMRLKKELELIAIISMGIGWIIYQYGVNKIHEKGMNYYYIIIKLTAQCVTIMGILFFISIKLARIN